MSDWPLLQELAQLTGKSQENMRAGLASTAGVDIQAQPRRQTRGFLFLALSSY
jgi:hypothetical protein